MKTIVAKTKIKGISLEFCFGEIPDHYRTNNFGPVTEFALPDRQCTDSEFETFLIRYRNAPEHANHMFV